MWLIVGLGNPGAKYELTRHNAGFLAVDALLDKLKINHLKAGFSGQMARLEIAQEPAIILKPETFMNKSGLAVQQAMSFHKIPLEQVIVLHDELDIPFDSVRLKSGGGHGGHNGLRDIISAIGTGDFTRVRIGIGRPPGRQPAADYVLKDFTSAERDLLPSTLTDAADATELITTDGLTAAQLKFHSPR